MILSLLLHLSLMTDMDYEFSFDPKLITLVESDPFHGYETETIVAHLTKVMRKRFVITIFLNCFLSH